MKTLILIFCACLFSTISFAQNLEKFGVASANSKGLQVGDIAPNFSLQTATGETIELYKVLQSKEVAVVFYRGEWCPVCSKYLSNFTDSLAMLTEKGIQPLFVSPNKIEKTQASQKQFEQLVFLQDQDYQVMQAFDVEFSLTKKYQEMFKNYTKVSVEEMNNTDEAKLPVPATFLIGKDKKIKFVQFDYNYSNRATVSDLLNQTN